MHHDDQEKGCGPDADTVSFSFLVRQQFQSACLQVSIILSDVVIDGEHSLTKTRPKL